MEPIKNIFSDNEGNHLMVALDFCDYSYKVDTLQIPEEYSEIEIVDISIEKVFVDRPINPVVFFRMSSWLLQQFLFHDNAIFTYICSTDDLATNHVDVEPQRYRWELFDKLFQRMKGSLDLNIQDVIVGPDEYLTYGRAFYRNEHSSIIHIVAAHLEEKQRLYQ